MSDQAHMHDRLLLAILDQRYPAEYHIQPVDLFRSGAEQEFVAFAFPPEIFQIALIGRPGAAGSGWAQAGSGEAGEGERRCLVQPFAHLFGQAATGIESEGESGHAAALARAR